MRAPRVSGKEAKAAKAANRSAPTASAPVPSHPIHELQRTAGNQAVARSLANVQRGSALADVAGANAVTSGGAVHLSSSLARADEARVLAHESVHLAQQTTAGPVASPSALEAEADRLTADVLAGRAAQPRLHADPAMALADKRRQTAKDKQDVEVAKRRREVLQRYLAVLEGHHRDVTVERGAILDRRRRLDDSMGEFLSELDLGYQMGFWPSKPPTIDQYRQKEQQHLAGMNRGPIKVDVTPVAVRIRAKFHVRFEGISQKEAEAQFPTLRQNFETGVRDTWNQTLTGAAFSGRTFELVPELTLIPATAPRNQDFWLITVRPRDFERRGRIDNAIVYGGRTIHEGVSGTPTSATDPLVDGGIISIPPSHITKPEVLGHETLHLFGMVDRYMWVPKEFHPSGKAGDIALRETGGRKDPLGGQGGKILPEDLGFVLDEFGAYREEEARMPLGAGGMSHQEVLAQLKRVEEIIELGYDPNSLVQPRQDFMDKMIQTAEDID